MASPVTPTLTVDAVVVNDRDQVLLIRRAYEPFKDQWALPGGHVDVGETTEAACARELQEETGLIANNLTLIGVFSDPERDPRGHVVSIAYLIRDFSGEIAAASDARDAGFHDWQALELAFDHRDIIGKALP